MKAIGTLLLICLVGCFTTCHGQTKQTTSDRNDLMELKKNDTAKQMNLLNERVKMYGQIFELAGAGESNPLDGTTNYLELLAKIDLPPAQKETLYEQYRIYDLSLDPKKNDSLQLMVTKMMTEALEKNQNKH